MQFECICDNEITKNTSTENTFLDIIKNDIKRAPNSLISANNNDMLFISARRQPDRVDCAYIADTDIAPDEPHQVDELFTSVAEIKRHPECLLTANGLKYITIEIQDKKYSIPCKKIRLQCDRRAYVGYFQERMLVSDGDLYHIDNLLEPTPITFIAALYGMMAYLSQVVNSHLSGGAGFNRPAAKIRQHTQATGHPALSPPVAVPRMLPSWANKLLNGRYQFRDPLRFPAAAANKMQGPTPVHETPLFYWPEEISILIEDSLKNNTDDKFIVKEIGRINGNDGLAAAKRSRSFVYNVDGIERVIHIPNKSAQALFLLYKQEVENHFQGRGSPLAKLIALDIFFGKKIAAIFDDELHLSEKIKSLDSILIKKFIEELIEECLVYPKASLKTKNMIYDEAPDRVLSSNYLFNADSRLLNILDTTNLEAITAALEFKNGMPITAALVKIAESYQLAAEEDKNRYVEYYVIISIMEQAHRIYCSQLNYDNELSTIDRVLYLNDREFLEALLEDDIKSLEYNSVKRYFYLIFEYNRNNGVSIHENVFIIPGEHTNYWKMFQEDEIELDETAVKDLFTREILSYINRDDKDMAHLEQLINIYELFEESDSPPSIDSIAQQSNILALKKAKNIIKKRIEANSIERSKFISSTEWMEDFTRHLENDKKLYLLVDLLIDLQVWFNKAAENFLTAKPHLGDITQVQLMAMSKLYALGTSLDEITEPLTGNVYIETFDKNAVHGNLEALITASIYWYFSQSSNNDITFWKMNALNIIRDYKTQEKLISLEMQARSHKAYTSIYKLKQSGEMEQLDDYYRQFIEYTTHDVYFEARNMTFNAITYSSLDYLDVIFPPKEVYTYKIFSRQYVQNTLVSDNWVSVPGNNIGFLTFIKSRSDQLILLSTLSNVSILKNINALQNNEFITRIIPEWEKTSFNLKIKDRNHISISEKEINLLFSEIDDVIPDSVKLTEFILIPPKEDQLSNPKPPYTLVAIEQKEEASSLISLLDYLNEQTLLEISESAKKSLLKNTWTEYILGHIPFFTVFWQHWHDPEHKIFFHDIIFDIFDLLIMIFPAGISLNKLSHITFVKILKKVKAHNVPKDRIKVVFLQELLASAPEFAVNGAELISKNILSFFNPLPFTDKIISTLFQHFAVDIKKNILYVNKLISINKKNRDEMRNEWSVKQKVDKNTIMKSSTLSDERSKDAYAIVYIQDKKDFFQANWDRSSRVWRIVRPGHMGNFNHAIPVKQIDATHWTPEHVPSMYRESPVSRLNSYGDVIETAQKTVRFEPFLQPDAGAEIKTRKAIAAKETLKLFIPKKQESFFGKSKERLPISTKLSILNEQLNGKRGIEVLFGKEGHLFENSDLIDQVKDFISAKNMVIKYRSIYLWESQHDTKPKNQLALVINIDEEKFIIDLQEYRLLTALRKEENQVFYSYEWLQFYTKNLPPSISLAKYKDFADLNNAVIPHSSEANPGKYIEDAFLLREPIWYKSLAVRFNNNAKKNDFALKTDDKINYRVAARKMISQFNVDMPPELFPLNILRAAGMIENDALKLLANALTSAKKELKPIETIIKPVSAISSFEDLLKINNGKFLLVQAEGGLLQHAMMCIGNGRFAGVGNHFYHSSLPSGASIIVAEEMGIFSNGKLWLREQRGMFTVTAGNPVGSKDIRPTLIKNPGPLTREEALLGEGWRIEPVSGLQTRIRIMAHGAPFNVNHMDALELSQVIRGLFLNNPYSYDLKKMQSIELFSCFGSFGGKYSTAQILANELDIPVKAYPAKISESIKLRHPEWFNIYQPMKFDRENRRNMGRYAQYNAKLERLGKRHAKLHDLMVMALNLRKAIHMNRGKRSIYHVSAIYVNLARLIIADMTLDQFVTAHNLDNNSKNMLNTLIMEYAIIDDNNEDIFLQAYMDIILTVDNLKHLAKDKYWPNSDDG